MNESLERISLLNLSWQRLLKSMSSRANYDKSSSMFTSIDIPRSAPITGQLDVRLLGCQDLLENVPDRQKKDGNTIEKTPKSLKMSSVMSGSKSYTVRGNDTSSMPTFNLIFTKNPGYYC